MEIEYRENIEIPPTLLYKRDLYELLEIFKDDEAHKYDKLDIIIKNDKMAFTANTLDELFDSNKMPVKTNAISINKTGWKSRDCENKYEKEVIDRSISINMYHNHISCSLTSRSEDWLIAKKNRIETFFGYEMGDGVEMST